MKERPKNRNGSRNEVFIDWRKVDELLEAGCTGTQIAGYFGICPDTLYKRVVKEKGMEFSAFLQQKRSKGNTFLHKAQYDSALAGNVPMLIWLGKQRLDQREPETRISEECRPALIEYLDMLKKKETAHNVPEKPIDSHPRPA